MRSRAVSRPFLCCDSIAFAPPPCAICVSSFLICVTRSTTLRLFLAKSGDLVLTLVFRTDAGTRNPSRRNGGCCRSVKKADRPDDDSRQFSIRASIDECERTRELRGQSATGRLYCAAADTLSRNSALEAPVTTFVEVLAGGCASGFCSSDSSGK